MRIIGHRGARGEAPENTLGGFDYALSHGISHFELDLHLSADEVPVVIHDETTGRTCDKSLSVSQSTASRLQQLNAAANEPWTEREPVPSLAQLLPLLEKAESVQLEIKSAHPSRLARLLIATRDLLRNSGGTRYTLTSFDRRALALARQLVPGVPRGLVSNRRFIDNVQRAHRLECDLLVYHYQILSGREIRRAQKSGLEVSCYTVNDLGQIKKLREWGVDSVITDHPVRYFNLQN